MTTSRGSHGNVAGVQSTPLTRKLPKAPRLIIGQYGLARYAPPLFWATKPAERLGLAQGYLPRLGHERRFRLIEIILQHVFRDKHGGIHFASVGHLEPFFWLRIVANFDGKVGWVTHKTLG
jgi:hypothetical protein